MHLDRNKSPGCSVVVPCYQEEKVVAETVRQIHDVLAGESFDWEMIFVDDGSTDATGTMLDDLSQRFPRLRVIHNEKNMGYGASLKRGFRQAKYDRLAITDADGTYPNERIPEFVKLLDRADMVVGARIGANVNVPLLRRPVKSLLLKFSRWMSQADIRDINSGLRCMWAHHLATFWFMLPDTFSFTTTITLAMHMHGLTVEYVPIDYHQRIGRSSIRPVRDTVKFFSLVVRAVMYFRPLQVFGSLALFLMIASAAVGILSKFLGQQLPDVIITTMFSTGIILFALGLLGDLINVRRK